MITELFTKKYMMKGKQYEEVIKTRLYTCDDVAVYQLELYCLIRSVKF